MDEQANHPKPESKPKRRRRRRNRRGAKPAGDALARLDHCTRWDRLRLRGRVRRLNGAPPPEDLARAIEQASERRARRAALVPTVTYPPELPVSAARDEIKAAIRDHQVVVLCGETGSGKTTQLPKICLELGRGIDGAIGHTQPRRIAARSVAARIAKELRAPLGQAIGYKVRFGDRTAPTTLVKVMTDGVLLAETLSDPNLNRYDTIIIDEAHERSLNIDFLLGYLHQLLPKRPDLKVIITSATIDPKRFAEHFGDAPIIEVSGRTFPVEVRYRPLTDDKGAPVELDARDLSRTVADEVALLYDELPEGDILVFLSGEREIRETAKAIRDRKLRGLDVLPLYARLAGADQDKVFQHNASTRRVVLATNIAETSITVPNIRGVIDPGLARMSRYSARSRLQRLPIEPISRASADQRAGRCGRVAPGICVRLYSESDFKSRPPFTDPEILRTNLAAVILQMKALRLGSPASFPFIEPPRHAMIREGEQTLIELGALTDAPNGGELTAIGNRLAKLPIDPSLGRIILAGGDNQCLAETLILASALAVQDPRERPADVRDRADSAHEQFVHEGSDFFTYLNLWRWFHDLHEKLGSSKLKRACQDKFINYVRMREWVETHRQLTALAHEAKLAFAPPCEDPDAIHLALLTGFLSNVGHRTEKFQYQGPGASAFFLWPGSALFEERPAWVVAAEIVETDKRFARCVAPVQPKWIEKIASHVVARAYSDPKYDPRTGRVLAKEKVSLHGLPIINGRPVHFGPIDPSTSRELFIYHGLVREEWPTRGAFLARNRTLREQIEQLEAKQRKRDLVVDAMHLFAFYDERVPADVYTGEAFETWREQAEKRTPELLWMTEDDLLERDPEGVSQERFPDAMEVAGAPQPLSYKLEPGSKDDGVTLTIPVEALASLHEERTTWLVPGLLEEKIAALVRNLPKAYRRSMGPVPQLARDAANAIAHTQGDKTMLDAVADYMQRASGLNIPRELWRLEALPDHLRMNVRVVDDKGDVIGEGRDVPQLRRDLAHLARERLGGKDQRWTRAGATDWDFDEIPQSVEIERAGQTMMAFPALVDEGATVALRLFETRDAAARSHHLGLRRLFTLRAREELKVHGQYLPGFEQMVLHFATVGDAKALRADLLDLLADRLFIGDRPDVRTQPDFDARLDAAWHRMGEVTHAVCDHVANVLEAFHRASVRLADPPRTLAERARTDLHSQLEHLVYQGFLSATPWRWLSQYPRYLRALELRIDRAPRDAGQRDAQLAARIYEHWAHTLQWEAFLRDRGGPIPAYDSVRWMVEEFRVATFAQDLGTSIKVSEERLAKAWEALQHASQ
ncbi:MAG: ATP-dependent RNA helicase HrpA [Phycisphaerales bacterium]|nr:ATP-dependent RNA helicase HrpA [Phycisphaerales bacterium]